MYAYGHPDAVFGQRVRIAIHFFVKFGYYYWVYLHQIWNFVKRPSHGKLKDVRAKFF